MQLINKKKYCITSSKMADHTRISGAGEVAVILVDAKLQSLAVDLERHNNNI